MQAIGSANHTLLRRLNNMSLASAFQLAYAHRSREVWLLNQLCFVVAGHAQDFAHQNQWPTDPLTCLTTQGKRKRMDRAVRQVLGDLPMRTARNLSRTGKLLQRLGLSYAHRTWVDHTYMKRYLMSVRKHMPCLSYGYTSDKSRKSGRDWLAGSLIGYESNRSAWMQPLAIPLIRGI